MSDAYQSDLENLLIHLRLFNHEGKMLQLPKHIRHAFDKANASYIKKYETNEGIK